MSSYTFLFLCIQACLIQYAYSQCGCNNGFGAGILSNGLVGYGPGLGLGGAGLGLGPAGLGLGAAGLGFAGTGLYGGVGTGQVGVAGEMPVAGATLVAGQVPAYGLVEFSGVVPAGGVVSIAGNCGCGCNGGIYY